MDSRRRDARRFRFHRPSLAHSSRGRGRRSSRGHKAMTVHSAVSRDADPAPQTTVHTTAAAGGAGRLMPSKRGGDSRRTAVGVKGNRVGKGDRNRRPAGGVWRRGQSPHRVSPRPDWPAAVGRAVRPAQTGRSFDLSRTCRAARRNPGAVWSFRPCSPEVRPTPAQKHALDRFGRATRSPCPGGRRAQGARHPPRHARGLSR